LFAALSQGRTFFLAKLFVPVRIGGCDKQHEQQQISALHGGAPEQVKQDFNPDSFTPMSVLQAAWSSQAKIPPDWPDSLTLPEWLLR
jgi:hypothetical protein